MPSLVTSIIGGIQGASASHNAAAAQRQGYQQASTSVNNAVGSANPILDAAATTAGTGVTDAAKAAGTGVTAAAGSANQYLSPYVTNGTNASDRLNNLTQAGFSFNPTDLANTPGYQFALQQGLRGVNAAGSATGGLNSGANLKAAANYATGLASTTYQQQYQDALQSYQSNVNSLLPGAQMGLTASGQSGANLLGAAQYTGNTGVAGSEYAGNAGMWSGGQRASNLVNAGVYTGNTEIGSGNATAQGDIGAANSWNSMLGGIGTAANAVFGGGFGGNGGWSFSNLGQNLGNLYGAGNYGSGGGGSQGPFVGPPDVFGTPVQV